MGDRAKPALPQLATLMDTDDAFVAQLAMLASLGQAADASPCLMKGLTNRFPDVRNEAIQTLLDQRTQLPELWKACIPVLKGLLNDPDARVRRNAEEALKEIKTKRLIRPVLD
jgi:HEAT repeat protein